MRAIVITKRRVRTRAPPRRGADPRPAHQGSSPPPRSHLSRTSRTSARVPAHAPSRPQPLSDPRPRQVSRRSWGVATPRRQLAFVWIIPAHTESLGRSFGPARPVIPVGNFARRSFARRRARAEPVRGRRRRPTGGGAPLNPHGSDGLDRVAPGRVGVIPGPAGAIPTRAAMPCRSALWSDGRGDPAGREPVASGHRLASLLRSSRRRRKSDSPTLPATGAPGVIAGIRSATGPQPKPLPASSACPAPAGSRRERRERPCRSRRRLAHPGNRPSRRQAPSSCHRPAGRAPGFRLRRRRLHPASSPCLQDPRQTGRHAQWRLRHRRARRDPAPSRHGAVPVKAPRTRGTG